MNSMFASRHRRLLRGKKLLLDMPMKWKCETLTSHDREGVKTALIR